MDEERRFDEHEIAEILERAASSDASGSPPASRTGGTGLTLSELQEIGAEVGIPPERIAHAARHVGSPVPAPSARTFLGAPRTVSRIVSIPRALDDDEWTRLVVDLRQTFDAEGRATAHGPLRSWSNGNLQVHMEPDGDRYHVRMRTLKGDVTGFTIGGAAFLFLSAFVLLLSLLGEGSSAAPIIGGLFGAAGLGQFAYARFMLSRWAGERTDQMEGLAERIPRLLED